MAFIEPMHRNKPNITYSLTSQHSKAQQNRVHISRDILYRCALPVAEFQNSVHVAVPVWGLL